MSNQEKEKHKYDCKKAKLCPELPHGQHGYTSASQTWVNNTSAWQTSNNCPAVSGAQSCTPQPYLKSAAGRILVHSTVTYCLGRFIDIEVLNLN